MMKVLAAHENSAEQNRRIHRGHFGVEHALPGFGVGEVVEKPAVIGQLFPQKAQGGDDSLHRSAGGDEAPMFTNAESGKTEPRRSNAGGNVLIVVVNVTAVLHHPGFRAALLPEKKKAGAFHVVQELVVFGRYKRGRGSTGNWGGLSLFFA